jgi:hypothetical protein
MHINIPYISNWQVVNNRFKLLHNNKEVNILHYIVAHYHIRLVIIQMD